MSSNERPISLAQAIAERDAAQAELDRLRSIPELRVGQRLRHVARRLRRGEQPTDPTATPSPGTTATTATEDSRLAPATATESSPVEPDDPHAWLSYVPAWVDTRFDSLAVQVVLFDNDADEQLRLARAIAATVRHARSTLDLGRIVLRYGDCSPEPCLDETIQEAIEAVVAGVVDDVTFEHFGANLGSSGGSNALAERGDEAVIWVLNPDTYPAPDAAARLLVALSVDGVGITEARQVPIEHPKAYDPITGETSWAVGYSLMARRSVFDGVGGFDPHFFPMYCDDVDLSWRVRLAGSSVVHVPAACVVHDKPISMGGAVVWSDDAARWSHLARLWLAHRYGRADLAADFVASVDPAVDPVAAEAIAIYEQRVADGDVPPELADAADVAHFTDGRLEPRRFGYA
ncbi:MAG: hypothetical protein AB8G26_13240 [Ilumatobacter sp.]